MLMCLKKEYFFTQSTFFKMLELLILRVDPHSDTYCCLANFIQFLEMYIFFYFRSASYGRSSFVVTHISHTPKSLISALVDFFQFQRYNTTIIYLKMNVMMLYNKYNFKKSTFVFGISLKLKSIVKIMKISIFGMRHMFYSMINNMLFSRWFPIVTDTAEFQILSSF